MSSDAAERPRPLLGSAVALAIVCFVAYNANGREIPSYDSQGTRLLAIELVKRHTFSLGHVVGRTPALGERPAFMRDLHGNYRSAYPLPSSLSAAAVAWVLSAAHVIDLDAPLSPALVAKLTASALLALAVALAFVTASRRTTRTAAAVIAVAFGLGTNIWAGASQTLWQQETALSALMLAILLLSARTGSVSRAVFAGLALGLAGWARLQLAPTVAILALSMPVRWGRSAFAGWLPIAAIGALAMGINVRWFGHPVGPLPTLELLHPSVHHVASSLARTPWASAAGLLFSPSRGLLIFSPVVIFSFWGVGAARREGAASDLGWCAAAAAAQFGLYSMYAVWWGGHTFGPRYALDMLPALVPIAAAGAPAVSRNVVLRAAVFLTLIWSIGVAALGAFVYPAEQWNNDPVNVDGKHSRLWEWKDSQIVRCARAPWSPQNFAFAEPGALRSKPR
jgi:hypothetical protein